MPAILAALAALLVYVSPASALTITDAKIAKGAVQVKGKGAVPFAAITFDGVPVGTANKSGGFKFATDNRPSGCVAVVSDGASRTNAVIAGCGSLRAVVVDGTDREVGVYLETQGSGIGETRRILRILDGRTITLTWHPSSGGKITGTSEEFFFPVVDCQGDPYLGGGTVIVGDRIYRADPNASSESFPVMSYGVPGGPCRNSTSGAVGSGRRTVSQPFAPFVGPYRLELR